LVKIEHGRNNDNAGFRCRGLRCIKVSTQSCARHAGLTTDLPLAVLILRPSRNLDQTLQPDDPGTPVVST
jgi:hypothetical protein